MNLGTDLPHPVTSWGTGDGLRRDRDETAAHIPPPATAGAWGLKEVGMKDGYEGLRLCYVKDQWAWFTDQPLDRQWGDDWNDAPYEHNAGYPYDHRGERVIRVAFVADLVTPDHGHINSPYSVQDINAGAVAWLRSPEWSDGCVTIRAGASFDEFVDAVKIAGGSVFTPLQ